MARDDVLKALAVTAELTLTPVSEDAARQLYDDIKAFDERQVLGALRRIRLDGVRLTVGNIVQRLDDGRPGPEEAFAMLPRNEAASCVMTPEMAQAWGLAQPLLEAGEEVHARMAFKEAYVKLLQEVRENGVPVTWFPSLGTDPTGREGVLMEAARRGRLSRAHTLALMPPDRRDVAGERIVAALLEDKRRGQ